MNTPASREGNLVRYGFYIILYLLLTGCEALAVGVWHGNAFGMVVDVLLELFVFYFLLRRFNREQVYFDRSKDLSMLDDFWLLLGLTVLVVAIRLVISYLQVNGHLPQIWLQSSYDSHENSVFFWLLLVGKGCLLAGSQEYIATGFLYNYFFRDSTTGWGLVALLASGLIFALLNFTAFIPLFVINTLLGMLFAWAYLATHSIAYPLYLAILNGVLQVILL